MEGITIISIIKVGFLVVEPVHLGSSPRLDMGARISEAPMATSSISRFADPTQFFGGAHRDRVCVCAFIGGECALVYV